MSLRASGVSPRICSADMYAGVPNVDPAYLLGGAEKGNDSYRIARVEKVEGSRWSIVSLFSVQNRQVEFPIPATVKFAGDVAVLILDDVRAGPGKANWSARVMFHDDVYAGRWWETSNPAHGGTIAGTISRTK